MTKLTQEKTKKETKTVKKQAVKASKTPVRKKNEDAGLIDLIVKQLDAGKAEDIVAIDLVGKASFADTMIVASGTSARHVTALARHLAAELKKNKIPVLSEGTTGSGNWVALDVGSVIVHLFRPETRAYYAIEDIWKTALKNK